MSDLMRRRGRLEIRASTPSPSKSVTKFTQPTDVIALTKTFTGSTSCYENILTMLPPPGYQIWLNEPVPVPNNTVAACYPSEFLESYTSVVSSSTTSSIVPAMSPFVCPKNYCTMIAESRNYIACCPTGYQLHQPTPLIDSNRPAYGGTCYSDLPQGTNIPVIAYDKDGNTASQVFSASTSGAQAYAHPIDGWALTSPTALLCRTDSSSDSSSGSSSSQGSSSPSSSSSSSASAAAAAAAAASNGISTGAIVGITIGAVLALVALIGLVWFLLARRMKQNKAAAGAVHNPHHLADDFGEPKTHFRSEAPTTYNNPEIDTYIPGDPKSREVWRYSQMNDGHGAFEMAAVSAAELPAETHKGADAKMGNFHAA